MENMLRLDSLRGKAGYSRDRSLGPRGDRSCSGTKARLQSMRMITFGI